MTINNNTELKTCLQDIIKNSGIKKTFISEKLGIQNQNFNRLINKNNLSLDEINKILSIIGYEATIEITKRF